MESELKVQYFSSAMEDHIFDIVFDGTKSMPSQAGQKYNNLMIEGFISNGCSTEAVCVPQISGKTYKKKWFNGKKYNSEHYTYLSCINIPVVRNVGIFLSAFFKGLFGKNRKNTVVFCDVLLMTMSVGVLLGARLSGKHIIGVVTDVPTKRALQAKGGLKKIISNLHFGLLRCFDGYVFLTKNMNELINTKNRPYIVAEGHVDHKLLSGKETVTEKYDKNVCMYAGSLKRIYGIENLVQGFISANIPDSELHIYGAGDYQDRLKELCLVHSNIKYFGVKPNHVIVEEERKVSLLINPRPTNEEYTKYSFPSKNMEYMASGTPLLTTLLPGMPEEYCPYVYLLQEENADGVKSALTDIFNQSLEERELLGNKAKEFVLKEKNNVVQVKQILSLAEGFKRLKI